MSRGKREAKRKKRLARFIVGRPYEQVLQEYTDGKCDGIGFIVSPSTAKETLDALRAAKVTMFDRKGNEIQ